MAVGRSRKPHSVRATEAAKVWDYGGLCNSERFGTSFPSAFGVCTTTYHSTWLRLHEAKSELFREQTTAFREHQLPLTCSPSRNVPMAPLFRRFTAVSGVHRMKTQTLAGLQTTSLCSSVVSVQPFTTRCSVTEKTIALTAVTNWTVGSRSFLLCWTLLLSAETCKRSLLKRDVME